MSLPQFSISRPAPSSVLLQADNPNVTKANPNNMANFWLIVKFLKKIKLILTSGLKRRARLSQNLFLGTLPYLLVRVLQIFVENIGQVFTNEKMSQRPFVLDPLFRPLQVLRGVGPKYLKLYQRLIGGEKLLDLIFHRPVSVVKREKVDSIAQARKDQTVIIDLIIDHHTPPDRKSKPYRIRARDVSGFMDLVFFNIHGNWIEQQYQIGRALRICGKIEEFNGQKQIIHPEILESDSEESNEIIYPLTGGVTLKPLRKAILQALDQTPELPEWLDLVHQKRQGWPSWRESIIALHHPQNDRDCDTLAAQASPALSRLAYDELLANQLTLQLVRLKQKKLRGRSLKGDGALRAQLLPHLPWSLTGAQTRAIAEIDADMASPLRMLRLLQGDVGSGKTIVALLAMLNAVESGAQAALMVPTEILARQHARTIEEFLKPLNVRCVTITGRDKGKARAELLAAIQDGRAQIVIGTHSLFQDQIEFAQLGLCVIDEQHRFGVHQRLSLSNKGTQCDVLVMTATPIPRTLELTAYGDMDVSRLNEKPPGRQKIDTRLIPREKLDDMMMRLKSRIARDERVYWVCPLVEESEVLDLAAATQRYEVLREVFGDQVGLIHGRMKPAEKDKVMGDFADGTLKILVATTVIEVGVHVPQANIMVVEHAERFGLAQLHQLRGRVGRGAAQSFCFLVYVPPLNDTAKERLKIMRESDDGFIIAEKDLELRGAGDVLGIKQSGMEHFKFADLMAHRDLLLSARQDASLILNKDPELQTPRGQALRVLLYLYQRDQAISYLRSG